MKTCITCGMPLEGAHEKDFGIATAEGPVCAHDSSEGKIKSGESIFEGGVQFFLSAVCDDRGLAERLVRKNMNSLPYWKAHRFPGLDGVEATDAEFAAAMAKL